MNASAVGAAVLDLSSSQPGVALSPASAVGWVSILVVIGLGSWLSFNVITTGARLTGIVRS
jgi:hypothetical protein